MISLKILLFSQPNSKFIAVDIESISDLMPDNFLPSGGTAGEVQDEAGQIRYFGPRCD